MQFSYQLIDNLDIQKISLIYSACVFGLVLFAGILVIFVSRFCVQSVIKKNQESWSKMAIEMGKIMEKANGKTN